MHIFWRRRWHPTPVLLPGKSHWWRSLVGYSPWGREELDTTERLYFHFSLSCIGEGNGNPFQCSYLENPKDGGAWWAAVLGSHRVGHDWRDFAAAAYIACTIYPKENTCIQPLLFIWWVFLKTSIRFNDNLLIIKSFDQDLIDGLLDTNF